jgi:type II secretory pathway component GspD/PulD (secretin)
MRHYFLALILIVGLFALDGGGHAQDVSASKNKRIVYVVKHGDAKDLASILGKHFKGEAEVQVLPDSPSNCLLISAAPNAFAEVVKLLAQLDRRPQLVSVELLIAAVMPKKGQDGKPVGNELDDKEFDGSGKEVLEKIETLRKNGLIDSLKRIQLTAVENQPASVLVGETKPVVSGVTTRGTGLVSRSITYRNTGTTAQLTARVTAENTVAMALDVSDARLHVPEDGIELGKDETGASIRATEIITATLKTKLNVRSEQAVAAQGVKTDSKSGQAQTLIIVAARILESGDKASR